MNYLEITLIALALAVDATVYAFSYGMVLRKGRGRAALWLALSVGAFQAGMPLLGYLGGEALRSVVSTWAPWIVLLVFGALGGSIIYKTWFSAAEGEEEVSGTPLGFCGLLLVGIATSIDALAVGVTFAFLSVSIGPAVSLIGCTTFVLSLVGVAVGNFFGVRYKKRAELAGGIILVLMGCKILLEHLDVIG